MAFNCPIPINLHTKIPAGIYLKKLIGLFVLSVVLTAVPACNPSGADKGVDSRDVIHNQEPSKRKGVRKFFGSREASQDSIPADANAGEVDTLSAVWSIPDSLSSEIVEEFADSSDTVENSIEEQDDEMSEGENEPMDAEELYEENENEEDTTEDVDDVEWEGGYESEDPADHVLTERMDRADVVRVLNPGPATARDSILLQVERRMSIRPESPPEHVIVERWLSPVNFRGYKFNVRKLLVYGVEPKADIQLYYYLEEYYFSIDRRVYELHQTSIPRNFESVRDTTLTRYLITLVDSL